MVTAPSPVVAILQVRIASTRLPGKVLKPLAGVPLIRRVVERVSRIEGVDRIAVALADGEANDAILPILAGFDIAVGRGPEHDVLGRTAAAARLANAATIVRITSDCPLIDPGISTSVLSAYANGFAAGIRYARTSATEGFPHGFDTEIVDAQALHAADREATSAFDREHVTPFIRQRDERFPGLVLVASPDRRHWRLTVDTSEDYALVAEIYRELHENDPAFGYAEIAALFARRPDLLDLNKDCRQPPHKLRR